tara:strand:- start:812 stop:1402 length:591 start_codon:yes stop_codon:yes gene_type:complete
MFKGEIMRYKKFLAPLIVAGAVVSMLLAPSPTLSQAGRSGDFTNMIVRGTFVYADDRGTGTSAVDFRNEVFHMKLIDISTAGTAGSDGRGFMAFPYSCKIVRIDTVLNTAITSADAALTFYNNSYSPRNTQQVSGVTITITQSGSAIGDVDTDSTITDNNTVDTVTAGSSLGIYSDGGSSTAAPLDVYVTCRRKPA